MSASRLAAMRDVRPFALALIAGLLAVALPACGGSSEKLIPPSNAAGLLAALDQVEARANEGACDTAGGPATDQVVQQIEALPDTVDESLKRSLLNGADRLRQLSREPSGCQALETTPTETTATTQTTQTQTETTPTETQTQTTQTEPPGSGGAGPGGGTAQGGATPGGP